MKQESLKDEEEASSDGTESACSGKMGQRCEGEKRSRNRRKCMRRVVSMMSGVPVTKVGKKPTGQTCPIWTKD